MFKISVTEVCFVLALTLTSAPSIGAQAARQGKALTLPADKDTVVRFFYQPNDNNYFHDALVFSVVGDKDPQLNTAPLLETGRSAYITRTEMQRVIGELSQLRVFWSGSQKAESLETYKTIHSHGGMSIKVFSPKGTADTTIRADRICGILAPLDAALETPRALWEFRLFRQQYHCKVPNFNPSAYPDRM